ncbi:lipopolysaccharide biosynthesis protein [Bythopirellula goksoeyrii]|uniref:Polysaccharide biosynthesis protein n=1 Tax=Bythopirellula goksoeyrii TaxID=1400387 RepID=A0A5B9QGU7_9BACT|nr:lipopolysaccharide biosynthesis protein [Bythopirellula goksoeyrii]QEG36176.1 Polysaccharide biosynthesis protein [Bythopirellula goksoeyrii]
MNSRAWTLPVFFTALASLAQKISLWGVVFLLAKLSSPEVVGQYAWAMAVALPITRLASLQLPQLILTQVHQSFRLGSYFAAHAMAHVVAMGLLGMVLLLSNASFQTVGLVLAVTCLRAAEGLSELTNAVQLKHHRVVQAAALAILRGILGLVVMATVQIAFGSLLISIASLTVAWLVFACCIDAPAAHRAAATTLLDGGRLASFADLTQLVFSSIPLGGCALLAVLFACLPRYLLGIWHDAYSLGIFEALVAISAPAEILAQAISRVTAPRFAAALDDRDRQTITHLYVTVGVVNLTLAVSGTLLVLFFGPALLRIAYSADYAAYSNLLAVLMLARGVAFLCNYDLLFLCMSQYRRLAFSWLLPSMVLIATSLITVPEYGLSGVIVAVLMGNSVRCGFIHTSLRRSLRSDRYASAVPFQAYVDGRERDGVGPPSPREAAA